MQLQQRQQKYAKEYDTQVVAATVQDMGTTEALAEELGVNYPVMTDTTHEVSKAYGIYNLPGGMGEFSAHSMFLIDKQGQVQWSEVSVPEMYIQPDTIDQRVAEHAGKDG